ncbi:AGAP003445-PA [Anopheles gambiae str. PEST]|uniref:AGAP003445-PA n=1 Tax=Anopheles gambiae TaxID=7165 RepID=Q7QDH2_ANOGA|nr:AGAP003445-PA [Anopheles gambiae str. PEST]
MDVAKLFDDLESNNLDRVDEVKRKFQEIFSSTKESWLACNMMEYFAHTSSIRIVEILVKVQQPHDKHIFDRLSEWIRSGTSKTLALTLFGHIIQKRPLWLYKVGNHQLVKEVLKLSKVEKDITSLINAVLCIIDLLPVIPLAMGSFVQDLFDVFNYLATWNQNESHLPEYQLIHLQFGLYELFTRLYGMYPCNFVAFLKQEYSSTGRQAVFQHTIKPLLDTVKIHPRLVLCDRDSETSQQRWKNMEPHDVVNECARMSLEYPEPQPLESTQAQLLAVNGPGGNECPCYMTPIKPYEYTAGGGTDAFEFPWKANVNFFNTLSLDQQLCTIAAQNSIWSPNSTLMQPTPPPTTGTVPHTPIPTPSYTIPTVPVPQPPAADGASPPEAAVEATPETTPMKDTKPAASSRPYPTSVKPQTARAIWTPSQPASPIKKDVGQSHFNYEYPLAVVTSKKLLQVVSDRNQSLLHLSDTGTTTTTTTMTTVASATSTTSNSVPSSPLPIDQQTMVGPTAPGTRNESPMVQIQPAQSRPGDLSQEDQEVNDINSPHMHHSQSLPVGTAVPIRDLCADEDQDQGEGSPCSAGGLHFKNSQSVINYTRRRLHSHCLVDSSDPYYSTGTSPADTSGNYLRNGATMATQLQQRRHSLPDLKHFALKVNPKLLLDSVSIVKQRQLGQQPNRAGETANGAGNNSASSSEGVGSNADTPPWTSPPSPQQQQQLRLQGESFSVTRSRLDHQASSAGTAIVPVPSHATISTATQTIISWPQPYEQIFYGILQEELRFKNSISQMQHEQQVQKSGRLDPYALLDQYIETCAKTRATQAENGNRANLPESYYQDHIRLLHLQLQYERHRREIHAERNRRLLGKSRKIRALEQNNEALKDQVARLTREIASLNAELSTVRRKTNAELTEVSRECVRWKETLHQEQELCKERQLKIEALQVVIKDETAQRREVNLQLENAQGELFDLRNELRKAVGKADLGQQYREELTRLQSELLMMGEVQLRFKEKLAELERLRAREAEIALMKANYHEEWKELKFALQQKSAQLDTAKERQAELEQQLIKREETITHQKRTLKTVKEENQEKFKALENKYEAQKAIIIRMEDQIEELRVQSCVAKSPDSDRTDAVGSLDHTSPLSISLASSEGIPEIRNLSALVAQNSAGLGTQLGGGGHSSTLPGMGNSSTSGTIELDSNLPTPTTAGLYQQGQGGGTLPDP